MVSEYEGLLLKKKSFCGSLHFYQRAVLVFRGGGGVIASVSDGEIWIINKPRRIFIVENDNGYSYRLIPVSYNQDVIQSIFLPRS